MDGTMNGNGSGGRRRRYKGLKFQPPATANISTQFINFCEWHPQSDKQRDKTITASNNSGVLLTTMTVGLLQVYGRCNESFHYDKRLNPRRVLTKPSRPTHNSGYDNEKHDYILFVNDTIGNEEGRKYVIMDLLGQGTFGQVVKCQREETGELVAVKVIKNQTAFFNQSMMEVTVLELLNQKYDREDRHHIVRMKDTFVFRQHLCIVVELLSLNLYDLIKQNQYRGFSLTLCRIFCQQILDAMRVLREARIVHCDLKPENILLRNLESPQIKVIDFGSACHEHQTLYTYIQSRFYRSPEVLLGLPYSSAIDMWSFGCIAAELFLGLPIFPGASNYDQISRIVATLGNPPNHMLEVGKDTHSYFERESLSVGGGVRYHLKSRERYNMDTGRMEPRPKQYFTSTDLSEIILKYPIRPRDASPKEREAELNQRKCFIDFVKGLLNLNPIERWNPLQALQHPFITGKPFTPFSIPLEPAIPQPTAAPNAHVTQYTSTTMAAATTAVAVKTAHRPRSNTLNSLSLQNIPPQMQKVGAAAQATQKDRPRLGGGADRREDRLPKEFPIDEETSPSTAFSTSPPFLPTTNHPLSGDNQDTLSPVNPHTSRMDSYLNNRRVSQPTAAVLGRYGQPARHAPAGNDPAPASLPAAVWYGPTTTTSDSSSPPSNTKTNNTVKSIYRRGSRDAGTSQNRRGSTTSDTQRRRSSTSQLSLPSMDALQDAPLPEMRSGSSSMMDVLDEVDEATEAMDLDS